VTLCFCGHVLTVLCCGSDLVQEEHIEALYPASRHVRARKTDGRNGGLFRGEHKKYAKQLVAFILFDLQGCFKNKEACPSSGDFGGIFEGYLEEI